jgi:hypothetical protein
LLKICPLLRLRRLSDIFFLICSQVQGVVKHTVSTTISRMAHLLGMRRRSRAASCAQLQRSEARSSTAAAAARAQRRHGQLQRAVHRRAVQPRSRCSTGAASGMQPKAAGAERGWQPLQRGQTRGWRAGRARGAAALARRAAAAHACRQRTALTQARRTAAAQRPLACSACTLAPELASGSRSRLGPAEAWRCGATGGAAADQAGRGAGLGEGSSEAAQATCGRRSALGGAISGAALAGPSHLVGVRRGWP